MKNQSQTRDDKQNIQIQGVSHLNPREQARGSIVSNQSNKSSSTFVTAQSTDSPKIKKYVHQRSQSEQVQRKFQQPDSVHERLYQRTSIQSTLMESESSDSISLQKRDQSSMFLQDLKIISEESPKSPVEKVFGAFTSGIKTIFRIPQNLIHSQSKPAITIMTQNEPLKGASKLDKSDAKLQISKSLNDLPGTKHQLGQLRQQSQSRARKPTWSQQKPFQDMKLFQSTTAESPSIKNSSQNDSSQLQIDSLQGDDSNQKSQSSVTQIKQEGFGQTEIFEQFFITKLVQDVSEDSQRIILPRIIYDFESIITPSDKQRSQDGSSLSQNVPLFCFPEWSKAQYEGSVSVEDFVRDEFGTYWDKNTSKSQELFSFVLTDINQNKRYGFCKRILSQDYVEAELSVFLPQREQNKTKKGKASDKPELLETKIMTKKFLPQVLCIISPVGSWSFYKEVLEVTQNYLTESYDQLTQFLNVLRQQQIPKPGRSLEFFDSNNVQYHFNRPFDAQAGQVSLSEFLNNLNVKSLDSLSVATSDSPFGILITILTALMLERKIIVTSKSLQKLSDSCNALISMIYPFEWQHVFIPILPRKLLDFVCSPTPYIIGVLSADLGKIIEGWEKTGDSGVYYKSHKGHHRSFSVQSYSEQSQLLPIEDALVINVDSGQILRHDTSDIDRNFLPLFLIQKLKEYLSRAFQSENQKLNRFDMSPSNQNQTSLPLKNQNSLIHNSFLRLFLLTVGPYRDFMDVKVLKQFAQFDDKQRAEIQVQFDQNSFGRKHPLLVYDSQSCLSELLTPNQYPPSSQKPSIRSFLLRLIQSQNFTYFIQQREDAFLYHYQLQIDKSNHYEKILDKDSGVKSYQALAQSRFEKKVTQLELQLRQKQNI